MRRRVIGFILGLGSLVSLAALILVVLYSRQQVRLLSGGRTFDTPEAGLVEIYGNGVKVTGVGDEVFSNLRYVSAVVESSNRCAGQARCSVGGFFLEINGSWAFVPEGRFPIVIAAGQKIQRFMKAH